MRTFRQPSSYRIGWLLIGVCGLLAVLFTAKSGGFEAESLEWLVAVALLIWAVMVRPSLVLSSDGIELHNVVRDVDVSWPVVDLVESRWNLKVWDEQGHSWGSWAISAQRPSGRGMRSGGMGLMPGRPTVPEPGDSGMRNPPASAAAIAEQIRAAQEDYDRALRQGAMAPLEEQVSVRPAWPSIGAIAVAAGLIVLAILTR